MHWTILPPEIVFAPPHEAQRRQLVYEGRQVECEATGDGGWRIRSLLSTDPADYLDSRFQPGTMLPSDYRRR